MIEELTNPESIDNCGVDNLAHEMRQRLAEKREKGYSGWHSQKECPPSRLATRFIAKVAKGEYIDAANYLMMLFNRPDAHEAHIIKAFDEYVYDVHSRLDKALVDKSKLATEIELTKVANKNLQEVLDATRRELEVTKANLSRALGYIDRVTEAEPPAANFQHEREASVGAVYERTVSGYPRRGPVLDHGIQYDSFHGGSDALKRFR